MYEENTDSNSKQNKLTWIVLAVVVAALIVSAVLFRDKLFPSKMKQQSSSGYQAVFLTNGQVYFGKLSESTSMYVNLKDIYYLQVTQPVQGPKDAEQPTPPQQAQIQLVKLGSELHGPQDEMQINRDQVLFFEDLKEEGRVVQAIREYQKNPPAQQPAQKPAPQPAK